MAKAFGLSTTTINAAASIRLPYIFCNISYPNLRPARIQFVKTSYKANNVSLLASKELIEFSIDKFS
jgi:hypothetical protein